MSERACSIGVAAFFDLDETLLAGDSDALWHAYLRQCGRAGVREKLLVGWHHWRSWSGRRDDAAYVAMQTRTIAGAAVEDVRRWYEECFVHLVQERLFPEAGRLVESHRRRGHRLVLCTRMNTLRCEPIQRRLGFDAVIGTELEIADGRCTGRIVGALCAGVEKAARIERYAVAEGVDLGMSYAYGDSHADLPMLEAVGHPTAVNPDPVLRVVAREREWPVLRFLPAPGNAAVRRNGHPRAP
jgi:HAD superfamily hydrolase (TIGR01490 family)